MILLERKEEQFVNGSNLIQRKKIKKHKDKHSDRLI